MIQTGKDIIRTIRLTPGDRRRLVEAMEKMAARSAWAREKRQIRIAYPAEELAMHVHQEGTSHSHAVISRNLSRWGISVLIGRFVYPDSDVTLDLLRLDGRTQPVRARVLRCRHISKMVHEISALFEEPIDLVHFVELTPDDRQRLESERAAGAFAHATDLGEDEAVLSVFPPTGPLQAILETVVRHAGTFSREMRSAIEQSDREAIALLARQLTGLGEGCGFIPLGEAARAVLDQAANEAALPSDVTAAADGLLDVLRRLRCELAAEPPPVRRPRG